MCTHTNEHYCPYLIQLSTKTPKNIYFQAGYSLLTIDETGKTALHYGARFGHKEILRFLISKAPERALDMIDVEKGQTALHKAAAYKRRTICCMLVAAGASLLIKVDT